MRNVCTSIIISVFAAAFATTGAKSLTIRDAAADPANDKQAVAEKQPPPIDRAALGALCRMGAFLQAQQSFTVRTNTETDYVTDDGQKLRLSAKGEVDVRRPNRLHAQLVSDRKEREFFYDGTTFTVYSPKIGFYSRVEAPPTIQELADDLEVRFGIGLPMVDLFRWGAPNPDFSDIKEARYVGPATIDGVTTDQYAFRQKGVDWQIWIQRGATPLPRKLVITTTDDRARPEHAIDMTWQLNTRHDDARFAFVPPEGSSLIAIEEGPPQPDIEHTQRAKRSARR